MDSDGDQDISQEPSVIPSTLSSDDEEDIYCDQPQISGVSDTQKNLENKQDMLNKIKKILWASGDTHSPSEDSCENIYNSLKDLISRIYTKEVLD